MMLAFTRWNLLILSLFCTAARIRGLLRVRNVISLVNKGITSCVKYSKYQTILFYSSRNAHQPPQLVRLYAASPSGKAGVAHPKLNEYEDYYDVLEVAPTADSKSIKKAFTKLVMKFHPDNKQGDEVKELCNRQMMVINAAYKVLKDPISRASYDRKRSNGLYGKAASIKGSGSQSNSKTGSRSGSSPNSNRSKQSADNARASRAYSSAATNDPFGGYYSPPKESDEVIETESMEDLLSEIFRDIVVNKGSNLMKDINEFLNVQAGSETTSPRQRFEQLTSEQLTTEVMILKTTAQHLKEHLSDLRGTLAVEEALLGMASAQQNAGTDATARITAMEDRIAKIESIRGLQARISASEEQYKQLSRDLDKALAAQLRQNFSSGADDQRQVDSGYATTSSVAAATAARQAQQARQQAEMQQRRAEAAAAKAADDTRRKQESIDRELEQLKADLRKRNK